MIQIPNLLMPVFYSRDEARKTADHVRPINKSDCDQIEPLVRKMVLFCRQHNGIGLAAPQVGIYVRLAIVLTISGKVHVLINPEITRMLGRDLREKEGCLSIPPWTTNKVHVIRAETIHVECGTIEEPDCRVESVHTGLEARVISHEVDHLNMTFIVDRCHQFEKPIALKKMVKEVQEIETRIDQVIEGRRIMAGVR